jgi:hypothetical protein
MAKFVFITSRRCSFAGPYRNSSVDPRNRATLGIAHAEVPTPLGDPAMTKPEETPNKEAGQALTPHRRTIKEALARKNLQSLPGGKMKQEGSLRRQLELSSLDAKATPFDAYDRSSSRCRRQMRGGSSSPRTGSVASQGTSFSVFGQKGQVLLNYPGCRLIRVIGAQAIRTVQSVRPLIEKL